MRVILIKFLLFVAVGQTTALFSDEKNARLPRLFHLDDHDRCLLQENGLYCLGEFDLLPVGTSEMYENIKKYSSNVKTFNRSRLYRGYCVSERCPEHKTKPRSALTVEKTGKTSTQRFEDCVNEQARRHALSARLRTLIYCTTEQEHRKSLEQQPDSAQQLFLRVVFAIFALNIVGTVYDIANSGEKKNRLIAAWSVRVSWRRLTATYDDGDPRLKQLEPIQGMRVTALLLAIYSHVLIQQHQFYVTNPQFLEAVTSRFYGIIMANGTHLMQMFVLISSFLTSYNMLIYSEKHALSFLMLPVMLAKRIIRISPVHLLLVGFAATYWPAMRSGATSAVIAEYSASCRRKFWTHALFLNNVVEKEDICLIPTWFLPVDMHLFLVSCALTIMTSHMRQLAVRLYATLFVTSVTICAGVVYWNGWKTMGFLAIADILRGYFKGQPSFTSFYTTSWGSAPACFMGLFLAHLHYELQQKKHDWNKNQWLKRVSTWNLLVGTIVTYLVGLIPRDYSYRWVISLVTALERPLNVCNLFVAILAFINFESGQRKFYGWRGWRVPARLSLPMMLVHWIVGVAITARPVAYHTSTFDVSIDYLATIFYGYALSVPVSLLVEIPVQMFFRQMF